MIFRFLTILGIGCFTPLAFAADTFEQVLQTLKDHPVLIDTQITLDASQKDILWEMTEQELQRSHPVSSYSHQILFCLGLRTGGGWVGGSLAACSGGTWRSWQAYTAYFHSEKQSLGIGGSLFVIRYAGPPGSNPRGVYKGFLGNISYGAIGAGSAAYQDEDGRLLHMLAYSGGLHIAFGQSIVEID